MKKIKFMLPMLAFVFAMVGAVAGSYLPKVQAYYRIGVDGCSISTALTDQTNCGPSTNSSLAICTVNVSGHPQAFELEGCQNTLRQIPQ